MTGPLGIDDEVAMPSRPDVPGLRFRRWTGFGDLVDMAAANHRTRDEAGIQDVINVEAMTRAYTHLWDCTSVWGSRWLSA